MHVPALHCYVKGPEHLKILKLGDLKALWMPRDECVPQTELWSSLGPFSLLLGQETEEKELQSLPYFLRSLWGTFNTCPAHLGRPGFPEGRARDMGVCPAYLGTSRMTELLASRSHLLQPCVLGEEPSCT